MDIKSGSSKAQKSIILPVDIITINIIGRDIMDKFGIHISVTPQQTKVRTNHIISLIHTKKYPKGYSTKIYTYVQDWPDQKTM